MSPIRRYLRITKYSVLEVRLYLDKPSDAPWLLSSRDNVLQRIIDEVRPKVLPKLREENENAKRKKGGKKKKGIKDVAGQDDFEVTIFLTELSSRHSLLTKQKQFTNMRKLQSTGNKLTGWLNTSENPIHLEDDDTSPQVLLEGGEDAPDLQNIPDAAANNKRRAYEADGEEPLFVSSSDEDTFQTQRQPPPGRRKKTAPPDGSVDREGRQGEDQDDKKKLALNTSYDGFSIYGRILCLVVERKGKRVQTSNTPTGGSQMMEHWVSTQAAQEAGLDEDGEG